MAILGSVYKRGRVEEWRSLPSQREFKLIAVATSGQPRSPPIQPSPSSPAILLCTGRRTVALHTACISCPPNCSRPTVRSLSPELSRRIDRSRAAVEAIASPHARALSSLSSPSLQILHDRDHRNVPCRGRSPSSYPGPPLSNAALHTTAC